MEQNIENQTSEGGPGHSGTGTDGAGSGGPGDKGINSGSSQHITSVEEKKQRVSHNLLLAGHFKNKARDPHGLLKNLKELHEQI